MILLFLGFFLANHSQALDSNEFQKYSEELNFHEYYDTGRTGKSVSVAVLDNDFTEDVSHGSAMANILTAFTTDNMRNSRLLPTLYLMKAGGYSEFENAITSAIEKKVDIILYSLVRDYGSNFDGKGFFNAQVNRALDAGIIWINAAGNYGKTTFNSSDFTTDADGWIALPGENNAIPMRCAPPEGMTQCFVRVSLSWNDFKEDVAKGTNKDLDLILTNDTLNILAKATLVQSENPSAEGHSLYPREIIETKLGPGRYFLRVKNRSGNFTSKDRLRLAADGESITFELFDRNESIFNPADNPRVITVGASDNDRSSISLRGAKPELTAPSMLTWKNQILTGSSQAAAIVAAGVALAKRFKSDLSREDIVNKFRPVPPPLKGKGMPTRQLGFRPLENNCFTELRSNYFHPRYIQFVLQRGGMLVQTTHGPRIVVPYDPARLFPELSRLQPDDIIAVTPESPVLLPRSQVGRVPEGWIEVFELPSDASVCDTPSRWRRKDDLDRRFRLPSIMDLIGTTDPEEVQYVAR